jgi:hypothetical protein
MTLGPSLFPPFFVPAFGELGYMTAILEPFYDLTSWNAHLGSHWLPDLTSPQVATQHPHFAIGIETLEASHVNDDSPNLVSPSYTTV